MKPCVKFGVIADLHTDIIFDAQLRLETFLQVCQKEKVDFVVQLGDFIYPTAGSRCVCRPQNRPINIQNAIDRPTPLDKEAVLALYQNFSKPHYHVLGNHDLDFCSKEQMIRYLGMPAAHYAFEQGGVRFIVLDCNFFAGDGGLKSFEQGNYFDGGDLPYLPPQQLEWLRAELLSHLVQPHVLFSHQRLVAEPYGIKNHSALRAVLAEYQALGGRVALCMNGHNHMDGVAWQDGVCFFDVNSAANQWLGEEYVHQRFSAQMEAMFPNLRYTAPYQNPLFALVEMQGNQVEIHGREGGFVPPAPAALGWPEPCTAQISAACFTY